MGRYRLFLLLLLFLLYNSWYTRLTTIPKNNFNCPEFVVNRQNYDCLLPHSCLLAYLHKNTNHMSRKYTIVFVFKYLFDLKQSVLIMYNTLLKVLRSA